MILSDLQCQRNFPTAQINFLPILISGITIWSGYTGFRAAQKFGDGVQLSTFSSADLRRTFAAFHQPSHCCNVISSRHLLFPQLGPFSHTFFVDLLSIIKPQRTVLEGKYHTCVCSRPGGTPPVLCLNQSLSEMTW